MQIVIPVFFNFSLFKVTHLMDKELNCLDFFIFTFW